MHEIPGHFNFETQCIQSMKLFDRTFTTQSDSVRSQQSCNVYGSCFRISSCLRLSKATIFEYDSNIARDWRAAE
eukprot:1487655-Amphidinium_carterae.1